MPKFIVADYYADLPSANRVYMAARLRVYPYVCPATGLLIERDVPPTPFLRTTTAATCGDEIVLGDFSAVAQNIEYCYVTLEVIEDCYSSCTGGNTTPWFDNVRLAVGQEPVAVDPGASGPPAAPELTVRPNPFQPATTLEYSVPAAGDVTLRIYDTRGALVRTLVNDTMPAGRYQAVWNGLDAGGQRVASGVYWAECRVGGSEVRRRIVLLK